VKDLAWSVPPQVGYFIDFVDDRWTSFFLIILRISYLSFFFWAASDYFFSWLFEALLEDTVVVAEGIAVDVEGAVANEFTSSLAPMIYCNVSMIPFEE
jgi:hypothetical protein